MGKCKDCIYYHKDLEEYIIFHDDLEKDEVPYEKHYCRKHDRVNNPIPNEIWFDDAECVPYISRSILED